MDLFKVQCCDARLDGALGHGVRVLWGGRSGTGLAVAGDEESIEQHSIVNRHLGASLRNLAGKTQRERAGKG